MYVKRYKVKQKGQISNINNKLSVFINDDTVIIMSGRGRANGRGFYRGRGAGRGHTQGRGGQSKIGTKSGNSTSSTEMKFNVNYGGKGTSATYDTVRDHVLHQIQKTFDYGIDIAEELRLDRETVLNVKHKDFPKPVKFDDLPSDADEAQKEERQLEEDAQKLETSEMMKLWAKRKEKLRKKRRLRKATTRTTKITTTPQQLASKLGFRSRTTGAELKKVSSRASSSHSRRVATVLLDFRAVVEVQVRQEH